MDAFNRVIMKTKGKFLVIFNNADCWETGFITHFLATINSHSAVSFLWLYSMPFLFVRKPSYDRNGNMITTTHMPWIQRGYIEQ